jgi:hypothetical protein
MLSKSKDRQSWKGVLLAHHPRDNRETTSGRPGNKTRSEDDRKAIPSVKGLNSYILIPEKQLTLE